MPITQDRFYSIIRAARAYYDALLYLRQTILQEYDLVQSGQRSPTEALDGILRASTRANPDPAHAFTIGAEEKHHQLTRNKNAKTAERMRARRGTQGTIPRPAKRARVLDEMEAEYDSALQATPPLPSSSKLPDNLIDSADIEGYVPPSLDKIDAIIAQDVPAAPTGPAIPRINNPDDKPTP